MKQEQYIRDIGFALSSHKDYSDLFLIISDEVKRHVEGWLTPQRFPKLNVIVCDIQEDFFLTKLIK